MTKLHKIIDSYSRLILITVIAIYIFILNFLCTIKYLYYGYTDFDLAIDCQTLWNICHGSILSSIHRIPFLGNHMRLILFPLALLYIVWQSPLLLLYLQTTAIAAGAWFVFKFASLFLSTGWSLLFSFLYLGYPPLLYMNLYEFHPVAFLPLFFLGSAVYYTRLKYTQFIIFIILACLCQENVSLIIVFWGIMAIIQKRSLRWSFPLIIICGIYFILSIFIIMPRCNKGSIKFHLLYSHLGNSWKEIFFSIIFHPSNTIKFIFSPSNINFLLSLILPVAGTSFLGIEWWIPLLPVILQRFLSRRITESMLIYHYQAEFIPFIFLSAIMGVKRLLNIKGRSANITDLYARLSPITLTSIFFILTLRDISSDIKYVLDIDPLYKKELDNYIESIPDDASVIATFKLQPRLSNRRYLYSLHHIYTGFYTLSDIPYPFPDADYILMDTTDPLTFSNSGFYVPWGYSNLQQILTSGVWEMDTQFNSFISLKKIKDKNSEHRKLSIINIIDELPSSLQTNVISYRKDLYIIGFNLTPIDKKESILKLYWAKESHINFDFILNITLINNSDNKITYKGLLVPGKRIFPPFLWPVNKIVYESYRILHSTPIPSQDNLTLIAKFIVTYVFP